MLVWNVGLGPALPLSTVLPLGLHCLTEELLDTVLDGVTVVTLLVMDDAGAAAAEDLFSLCLSDRDLLTDAAGVAV